MVELGIGERELLEWELVECELWELEFWGLELLEWDLLALELRSRGNGGCGSRRYWNGNCWSGFVGARVAGVLRLQFKYFCRGRLPPRDPLVGVLIRNAIQKLFMKTYL